MHLEAASAQISGIWRRPKSREATKSVARSGVTTSVRAAQTARTAAFRYGATLFDDVVDVEFADAGNTGGGAGGEPFAVGTRSTLFSAAMAIRKAVSPMMSGIGVGEYGAGSGSARKIRGRLASGAGRILRALGCCGSA